MTNARCLLPVLAWVTIAASAVQSPPSDAVIGEFEAGSVVATDDDGVERWTTRWTMREEIIESQPVIRMTEEGEGTYSGFDSDVQWRTEALWIRAGMLRPLEAEKVFSDVDGTPLRREHTEFDLGNDVIRFEREDLRSGTSTSETLEMPPDTLSVEGIAAALRTLPFEEGASIPAHVFTPEPALYAVTLELRERESRIWADGPVDAYKVEIVPRLGILGVFRFLVPNTSFWFAADPPHTWIRYEGPENGRGTPEIAIEPAR